MSRPGAVPPPIPPEVLDEERELIRKQLDLERGKSRILYEQAYQDYLTGTRRARGKGKGEPAEAVSEDQFYSAVRKAYQDAYSIRAYRDVLGDVTEHGARPAPETMPSSDNITTSLMKSGVPPQAINQWLKGLDPEALGAMIALSSNNPALATMAFAMNQRPAQQGLSVKDVIELNVALQKATNQPNINVDIPKLIEAVKSQPQAASPKEIVDGTLEAIKTGIALASGGRSDEPREPRHEGILETLLKQPEGIKMAKELGLIGGDTPLLNIIAEMRKSDQQFQEKMSEADKRWQLRLEQVQSERELNIAKIQESKRRTDLIASSLQRIGTAVARGVARGGGPEGKTAEEEEEPEEGALKQLPCPDCNAPITLPPDAKPGMFVTCAKCGAKFEITPPEPAKNQPNADASTTEEKPETSSKVPEKRQPRARFM